MTKQRHSPSPTSLPCTSTTRSCSLSQAYRKAVLRKIYRSELRRLQQLIPSIASRQHQRRHRSSVDTIAVVRAATRYIAELHETVLARIRAGSLPEGMWFITTVSSQQRGNIWPIGGLTQGQPVCPLSPASATDNSGL